MSNPSVHARHPTKSILASPSSQMPDKPATGRPRAWVRACVRLSEYQLNGQFPAKSQPGSGVINSSDANQKRPMMGTTSAIEQPLIGAALAPTLLLRR